MRELARREHQLAIVAVDDVAVVVDVLELVVRADLLQLRERPQQRAVVPEPDVLERRLVARQRARVERLVGGKLFLLDAVETVGGARHPDVRLDVGALRRELVGRHAQALQERRVHAEADHPHHEQRGAGAGEQAQAGTHDLNGAGDRGEHGQHGERAEHRQRGVDVGVRGAEHDATRGQDDLVTVEPEADSLQRQERRAEREQVRARAAGQPRPARGQHEAALQDVHGHGEHHRAGDQRHRPRVHEPPERQDEDEEPEVEAEHRILGTERRPVDVAEHGFPVGGRTQRRHDGDQQQHDRQKPPDEWLDHDAPGQAQLVLELPQHVRRRRARGHGEVGPEEQRDDERDRPEQATAQGQRGQENLGVADLLEPEPVGVQRDELQQHREHDQRDHEVRQRLRRAHRPHATGRVTSRGARRRGMTPDPVSARRSRRPSTRA